MFNEFEEFPQVPPSQPPPSSGEVMPQVAAAVGVPVESVAAGGRAETFSRPAEATTPGGPITRALAERIDGSSAQVDAVGEIVSSAADPTLDARVNGSGA